MLHVKSMSGVLGRLVLLVGLIVAGVSTSAAQSGPSQQTREAIDDILAMLKSGGDSALQEFAQRRLTDSYRASFSDQSLLPHLRAVRASAKDALGRITVEATPEGLLLVLSAEREVGIHVKIESDGRIGRLECAAAEELPGGASAGDTLDWSALAARMQQEEAEGFSGVVLAVRDGREVVRESYGVADREAKRATGLDTVYGIGSTPIDFTKTGILLLAQRGKLRLDDTIDKYYRDAPADKRAITLRQLMSGTSGLHDFHHVPGVDWDPDLAWVDRDTAVRRMLAKPLLFEPGKGDAHSHSAFGLLAAVIEIVSGESYVQFIRDEILTPAGMKRTGFYGETLGLRREDFAVGYGASSVGLPNIPPNWGPTSWLVMGSGGMYSTLDDMRRYHEFVESGRVLKGEWQQWQIGLAVTDTGGSDRGFFTIYTTEGDGSYILMLMNGEGRAPRIRALCRTFERLVAQRSGS